MVRFNKMGTRIGVLSRFASAFNGEVWLRKSAPFCSVFTVPTFLHFVLDLVDKRSRRKGLQPQTRLLAPPALEGSPPASRRDSSRPMSTIR
jgi:hypothetical protein